MGNRNIGWREELEKALSALMSSKPGLGQESAEAAVERHRQNATDVLSRHPALEDLLKTSDQWHLYSLGVGYPCNTEKLKSQLINLLLNTANRTGVEEAVHICDKVLTNAKKKNLPGFELTFFVGLKLTGRWDIAPGLYAVPYRSIQQQFGQRQARLYDPIIFGLDPKGEKDITVLVNELWWGPIIVSSSGRTLKDPYPVEWVLTYNHNPLLLIALIAITLNRPLSVVANALRAAPWVGDFLDQRGGGGSYFDPENRIDPRKGTEVNAQDQKSCEQALKDWDSFADSDRDTLALAITRLSTSLSRSGTLAGQDRVLDISIALEILYKLDRSEITYKLSTRAGWYLGNHASERLRVRKIISDFYGFRSAIIHSGRTKKSDRNGEIHSQALDIARKTLLKHLSTGSVPSDQHWNEIVMGQENSDGR